MHATTVPETVARAAPWIPQSREAKVTVNQQIIQNDVDDIGGYVGTHGNSGISRTSLCRVNSHLNTVKNHAAHDDAKISNRPVIGIGGRSAEVHNRTGKGNEADTQNNSSHNNKQDRRVEDFIGGVPAAAPLVFWQPVRKSPRSAQRIAQVPVIWAAW